MRVWKVRQYVNAEHGDAIVWFATKRAAQKAVANQQRQNISAVDFDPVDIPRTKDGLVGWLNRTVTREIPDKAVATAQVAHSVLSHSSGDETG